MKNSLSLLVLILCGVSAWSQELSTHNYRDLAIPYIELNLSKYNYAYPIEADILDSINFTPPDDGVYFKSTYGHRYLSSTTRKTDNHGGFDYWSTHKHMGVDYDDDNKAPILNMCDGFISQVIHGPDSLLELTASGRSVRVTCDSISQAFGGGETRIYYRHLDSLGPLAAHADTAASGSVRIQKGDLIGFMGESGTTSNVHLHLSSTSVHPVHGTSFLSTARLFDPTLHPAILKELTEAQIEILQDWPDSTLFRITWPYNQTINQFEFINQLDTVVFNKEEAYQTGSAIRDHHDCLPEVSIFAYQFNGKQTAKSRYLSERNNMPAIYPASPQRDTNLANYGYGHFPIEYDQIGQVYDFMVKNISPAHKKEDYVVKLSDVWGYTIEGSFLVVSNPSDHPDLADSEVKVYPNPVLDEFQVLFPSDERKQVYLYDAVGHLIWTRLSERSIETFDLGDVPKGIYFLHLTSESGVFTRKLIKQ